MPPDTPTKTGVGLGSLPSEVHIKIAQACHDKDKPSTLHNLCLVSRYMDSVARKELYHRVSMTTCRSLRRLCRTLEEQPVLTKYIVELELLVPTLKPVDSYRGLSIAKIHLDPPYQQYLEVLKKCPNLGKLTMMMLEGERRHEFPKETRVFGKELSEAIKQSQGGGSTTAVLPRLQQVRLLKQRYSHPVSCLMRNRFDRRSLFGPFLLLPSLSSLESFDDSGLWKQPTGYPFTHPMIPSAAVAPNTVSYGQIKSMVLRDSNCDPTDVIKILESFPAMETLFIQTQFRMSSHISRAECLGRAIRKLAEPSEKRYLSDRFEGMQKLKALALIPFNEQFDTNLEKDFLGPFNFLTLTALPELTSLSALITLFASPDGETSGRLTVSPAKVLPRSLKSLHIIVKRQQQDIRAPLRDAWFQPRDAALQFLDELADICSVSFPALREVEYVWVVDRAEVYRGRVPWRTPCAGTVPECCQTHTTIQALCPYEDYTSRAEGRLSTYGQRFDTLESLFKWNQVDFKITELKSYSDYYDHWEGCRK